MTPLTAKVVTVWLALGLAIVPAFAQDPDPYAAGFDPNQPIRVSGRVRDVQWNNPRAWLIVITESANSAEPTEFAVMLPSPNMLERRGWLRETLGPGDSVTIDGTLATDGKPFAMARRVVAADGAILLDLDAQPILYFRSGADVPLHIP